MINRVDQSVRPDFKTAVIFLGRHLWLAHRFLTCRPNFMYYSLEEEEKKRVKLYNLVLQKGLFDFVLS